MDARGTVFYLVPFKNNKYATAIVRDPANRDRACEVPHIAAVPGLRIALDQQLKSPPHLARFGRHERNDVILNNRFSRNDQCYFDFNKETGELLLHDLSENNDTQLHEVVYIDSEEGEEEELGRPQISKARRQCVVVLSPDLYRGTNNRPVERQWFFMMRDAEFLLIPPGTYGQNEATLTEERLAFAGQPDHDRTIEGTMQRLITLGMQSEGLTTTCPPLSTITFNRHNTRFRTPLEPEEKDLVRYTKLRPLGSGGQGEVHKVVDKYNGNHYACKIVAVKAEVPQWKIHSERDFRARVEMEVNLVQELQHTHIVPYTHAQGFKIGRSIEIFMPIYEGNLHDLLKRLGHEAPETVPAKTSMMLYQILGALDFVHTRNPQIIHRDIKPPNILYRGDKFLLTDFGIAKIVDTSKTIVGSQWYMAPEVWESGEQTPKVDIWGLGVTVVECLVGFRPERDRPKVFKEWKQWHQFLQARLDQYAPRFASMLVVDAERRPTARNLLNAFEQFTNGLLQNPPTNATLASVGVSSLANQANGTTMIYSAAPTPMDWTQTVATAFLHGNPQPTKSMQPSQPNPAAVQPTVVPPNLPAQPRAGRGGSIKSARSPDERQKKGHKRHGSSQNRRSAPSQSGVPKRTSSRKRRPTSKSIHKAQELQELGIA